MPISQLLLKLPTVNFTTSSKSLNGLQVCLALDIASWCLVTGRFLTKKPFRLQMDLLGWFIHTDLPLKSTSWEIATELLIKLRFFQNFHLHTQALIPQINLLKHSVTAQNNEHWSRFLFCILFHNTQSQIQLKLV